MDKSKIKKQGKKSQQDEDEDDQLDQSKNQQQQDSQLFENSQNQQNDSQDEGQDDSRFKDNSQEHKQFKKSQFQENEQQDSQFQDENQDDQGGNEEGGGGDGEGGNFYAGGGGGEDNFQQEDSNVNQSNFLKNAGVFDNSQMMKDSQQYHKQKSQKDQSHDFEEMQRRKQIQMMKKKEAFAKAKQLLQPKYNLYDFIFPAGKLAKLCRMHDYKNINDLDIQEVLKKFKLQEGLPVCIFVGGKESNVDRGKFYAGIARACFKTDAVIVDSGLKVGIEKFTLRRNVKLVAVAPESQIRFPKINPTKVDPFELANGHTHIFLLRKQNNSYMNWGEEAVLKFDIANQIATGESIFSFKRKICVLLLGDNPDTDYVLELKLAVESQLPIIVVPGTDICNDIQAYFTQEDYQIQNQQLPEILDKGHVYILDGNNSEEIASYLHFFLTVTPFKKQKHFEQLVDKSQYRYPHQGYGSLKQQKSQHQSQNQSQINNHNKSRAQEQEQQDQEEDEDA